MDIRFAILGFLSWKECTGYALKKLVTSSPAFHWSGNNNQIYTTLVNMHKEGLVTDRVEAQERYPSRRIYSITPAGQAVLRNWLMSEPELPHYRSNFLVQLAWCEMLEESELDWLLSRYEEEIQTQLAMLREREKRGDNLNPARSPREKYVWDMINENNSGRYEYELDWVRRLKAAIKAL
jgi:PadR family transcriptional regulator AphA